MKIELSFDAVVIFLNYRSQQLRAEGLLLVLVLNYRSQQLRAVKAKIELSFEAVANKR